MGAWGVCVLAGEGSFFFFFISWCWFPAFPVLEGEKGVFVQQELMNSGLKGILFSVAALSLSLEEIYVRNKNVIGEGCEF